MSKPPNHRYIVLNGVPLAPGESIFVAASSKEGMPFVDANGSMVSHWDNLMTLDPRDIVVMDQNGAQPWSVYCTTGADVDHMRITSVQVSDTLMLRDSADATVEPAPIRRRKGTFSATAGASAWLQPAQEAQARRVAMPPGFWMARIARGVFFLSPKTVERVFEEIIADYRHEMVKAEAKHLATAEMRWLRVQHWGGFLLALLNQLSVGILGKIIRALGGG